MMELVEEFEKKIRMKEYNGKKKSRSRRFYIKQFTGKVYSKVPFWIR